MTSRSPALCMKQIRHSAEILRLTNGATLEDCKASYRMLAKQSHPDSGQVVKGLDFREVGSAYKTMLDYFKK